VCTKFQRIAHYLGIIVRCVTIRTAQFHKIAAFSRTIAACFGHNPFGTIRAWPRMEFNVGNMSAQISSAQNASPACPEPDNAKKNADKQISGKAKMERRDEKN